MRLNRETFSGNLFRKDYQSPAGKLGIVASDIGIRAILCEKDFEDATIAIEYESTKSTSHKHLANAAQELNEFFEGSRKNFTVALDLKGTEFQVKAWQALRAIPFGVTNTYGEQATRLGSANKCRAVGGANSKNPVSIVVPCHRVIGKSGSLTGFAGGLDMKKFLLNFEGHQLP